MRRSHSWLALITVLWLATALRFHRLEFQSFWNDEGNSASLSARSVELIIEGTASDIHPPLYYLLLHGWRQGVGDSEFALRALSAFAGVLLVGGTYALGRRLFSGRTLPALLAALIAAVNPALVYYSQEARMYALLGLLAVLATYFFYLLRPWLAGERRGWRNGVPYFLLVTAGLYTHYFFAAVLLAHSLLILVWLLSRRVDFRRTAFGWVGLMALSLLSFLPWLPIFLRQVGGRAGDEIPALAYLIDAARWLTLGTTIAPGASRWPLLAFAFLLLMAFTPWRPVPENGAEVRRADHHGERPLPATFSVLLLLTVPLFLMLIAGTTRPAYLKFLVVAVPFLALLLGEGAAKAWYLARTFPSRGLPLLILLLAAGGGALWGSGTSLHNLYFDPAYARDDYRAMAARIARDASPDAGVILNAPNQWEVFTYYHEAEAPIYPLPRGRPDPEELAAELAAIAERHDRLYALFWGETERDQGRVVERWLNQHAHKAGDEWVGGVRFVTYAVPEQQVAGPEVDARLTFGERIVLAGYTVRGEQGRPGEIVEVTLYWEALRPLTERYKVFLHLVDERGELVAQRDGEPGGGLAPTTTWAPGEQVKDNHGLQLPSTIPSGNYVLRLGLYELADPTARLAISREGITVDFFPLAEVTVMPPVTQPTR